MQIQQGSMVNEKKREWDLEIIKSKKKKKKMKEENNYNNKRIQIRIN